MVAGDSGVKKGGRECDKVIRSLVSGFPNEVDFALNVLTVMSFEKPESVPIVKVMLGVWGSVATVHVQHVVYNIHIHVHTEYPCRGSLCVCNNNYCVH